VNALAGANYPASSEELAHRAEKNGGDPGLVSTLRGMGGGTMTGPDDVMRQIKDALGASTRDCPASIPGAPTTDGRGRPRVEKRDRLPTVV
jgi:hypothetical protein